MVRPTHQNPTGRNVLQFARSLHCITYSPPTQTWCGPPVNGEYQHWLQPLALSLAELALKVAPAGRNRPLGARTSKCGSTITRHTTPIKTLPLLWWQVGGPSVGIAITSDWGVFWT